MAKHVHLIGICGTAMATLAALLRARGFDVRGSDHHVYPPMSDFLRGEGITLLDGYDPAHISADLDLVVVGNAVSRGNVELEEVLDRKIRYCSLPEAIRDHFLWAARSIVVAGTHGKTTTTSLVAWTLTSGGLDPSVLVGGITGNFNSSYRLGQGRQFVIEGDEYDSAFFDKTAKFLKYLPDVAIVGNLEYDHADIYPDMESLRLAFRRFVNLVPRRGLLLLGADSPEAMALADGAHSKVETFGLADGATWQAHSIQAAPEGTRFSVRRRGEPYGQIELPMFGEFNVRNALAAIAVADTEGVSPHAAADAMRQFKGVKRRMQLRGTAAGVAVYDDFAHHPTAIAETLRGVRSAFPDRRIWAVFEPRSATSCRRVFQDDFAKAFAAEPVHRVILAAVFRANLPDAERLSAERLVKDLRAARVRADHIPAVDDIVALIAREAEPGDLVVGMSNGGFDDFHNKLLRALGERAA
ncbi:MAG TPA: UDP-N-acetylmuramate:L-alanyl-gamma-D-glutamyl-meso-diaminopimelate ligase [Vicinamibacterales bacterium]|nr:UDP-N-acetylmuramate:L-alanyl-gamma-D-glutamyl-meso-diaminopimelate ligase [Vicinamibacterales bacterium]